MFGHEYHLEHICSFSATLGPSDVIGPVPEGIRANFYVTGGEVSGPRINGKVRPVGGDWATLRTDGVLIVDVRGTLETDDGALISLASPGVMDFGEDGYQKFLRQEVPPIVAIRAVPRFQTAHPAYQWLNRLQCVAIGQADMQRTVVTYDIYALR